MRYVVVINPAIVYDTQGCVNDDTVEESERTVRSACERLLVSKPGFCRIKSRLQLVNPAIRTQSAFTARNSSVFAR